MLGGGSFSSAMVVFSHGAASTDALSSVLSTREINNNNNGMNYHCSDTTNTTNTTTMQQQQCTITNTNHTNVMKSAILTTTRNETMFIDTNNSNHNDNVHIPISNIDHSSNSKDPHHLTVAVGVGGDGEYTNTGKATGTITSSNMRRAVSALHPAMMMEMINTSNNITSITIPPSCAAEFAPYAALPYRGFPDSLNSVPGYILGPVLGRGGFCTVRKALHEATGEMVAVKIIEKSRLKDPKDRDRVDRECRVLRNLSNHVAIVRVLQCVETPDILYLVMENCGGGSLLDHIRNSRRLPEDEACLILQQMLHALQFCHARDIVHRDVKLENILLDEQNGARLIDFGLCGYYAAGKMLKCHCGSPSYAAPEIVGRMDYLATPVDVWSLGVVLFAMLAGYLPFHAKEKKLLSEKILAGSFKFPSTAISSSARDLIQRMLTVDPEARITLAEIWTHPWLASFDRWVPPGMGPGGLLRSEVDPASGAPVPDQEVMQHLGGLGYNTNAVWRSLRLRAADGLSAAYHLLADAKVRAQLMMMAAMTAKDGTMSGDGVTTNATTTVVDPLPSIITKRNSSVLMSIAGHTPRAPPHHIINNNEGDYTVPIFNIINNGSDGMNGQQDQYNEEGGGDRFVIRAVRPVSARQHTTTDGTNELCDGIAAMSMVGTHGDNGNGNSSGNVVRNEVVRS
jgi:5'-AMP-activated protein kinase catalytic alpha subunit